LCPKPFFRDLLTIKGDTGGRYLIDELVQHVPVDSDSIFIDIDKVQDLSRHRIHDKSFTD